MCAERGTGGELVDEILYRLGRRQSTAAVLFNHAIAERLGLGPTDHKCLDVVYEHGSMTGSELAAVTGLSSGAITGVVTRLERAGFLRRAPDPHDGRKQILSVDPDRTHDIDELFGAFHGDIRRLLEGYTADQLAAIADFLDHSANTLFRHAALLRVEALVSMDEPLPTSKGSRR